MMLQTFAPHLCYCKDLHSLYVTTITCMQPEVLHLPPVHIVLAQGGVTDQVRVQFYTNATAYEEWPSGGLIGNGTGGHAGKALNRHCSALVLDCTVLLLLAAALVQRPVRH